MAYAFVQQRENVQTASSSSIATSSAMTVTSGNLIQVDVITTSTRGDMTVADTLGNTYTETAASVTANQFHRTFYTFSGSSGTNTVTASFSADTNRAILAREYSGLASFSSSAYQYQSSPGLGTDAITTGDLTIASQPGALIGFSVNTSFGSLPDAGTGFTSRTGVWDAGGGALGRPEDRSISSTSAIPVTFTQTAGNVAHSSSGVYYLESGGGGGSSSAGENLISQTFLSMNSLGRFR